MSLGTTLKHYRKLNDWTQQKLADKVGVSRIYIQALESGRRMPAMKLLLRLADAFGVEPNELLCTHTNAHRVQLDSVMSDENDLWFRSKQLTPKERAMVSRIIEAAIDDLDD